MKTSYWYFLLLIAFSVIIFTTSACAGWHNVMVYMKPSSSGVTTEIKAVKLEANATVPKEKFQIPAGFTIQ
jgi:Cu/Ag efflux protein CusF